MILLIDNYDSFSYNLYQLVGRRIIISSGPGWPRDAGISIDVIKTLGAEKDIPILGVCAARYHSLSGKDFDTLGKSPGWPGRKNYFEKFS